MTRAPARPRLGRLLGALLAGAATLGAPGQEQKKSPADAAAEAYARGDYQGAASAFREQASAEPTNFVPRYNLACALALAGNIPGAVEALVDAVQHGFVDVRHLRQDSALGRVRADPEIARLISNWPDVLARHRDANLRATGEAFSGRYRAVRDDRLRVDYWTSFDDHSFEQARAEVDRVSAWAQRTLFPDMFDPEKAALDPWVVVVLPTHKDFLAWAAARYGSLPAGSSVAVGGAYDHDAKRLVCGDIGSSLRHEFMHVLHWRDCTRRGQSHAFWVQEGLGTLVEDYDAGPGGQFTIVPSWRTNIARRLERGATLTPVAKLCALSPGKFMVSRPLAMYAQVRCLMMFLDSRSLLSDWYRSYCDGYSRDESGLAALQDVLHAEPPAIDKQLRAYVRGLAPVPEELQAGMASLGVAVDAGSGEGPVISDIVKRRPGVAPADSLAKGDVITDIGGRPTRDIAELVRVLSSHSPGDVVEVGYRRRQTHGTARVTLVPKPAN